MGEANELAEKSATGKLRGDGLACLSPRWACWLSSHPPV